MAFDDFGDGSIWDNEDLVQESAVFRILTESKADGAPLTLEALCAADDIIQEVKSLNTELVQFLSAEEVATKLVDYIVTPRPPSRQEEAFRVPYIASEIIACAAPGVVRAVMSAPSADRPGVTALQRLLLFADRRSPLRTYLSAYAARAIEALAQAEPLQVARAALATPGVVDACVRHSDDPACTKVLSLLARLPFTAADPMFSGSGKVHPDDAASLAASIAACLHPAGRKLPRGRTGGGPSGAAVRSDPPALSAGEGGPSSGSAAEAGLIPAPGLAAAAESASANAAELVLAALQLARVRPGAGVFLLRDAVRGLSKGKVAASEARLAATVAVHPSAVDSLVSPGDSVHLLLAKDFGATAEAAARCLAELLLAPWEDVQLAVVEAGGVKALLDASEAFPWHSLLHSTVGDALQEALEEGALPATARHIVVDCELVRWVGRTLAITGHPSTLAKVGAPSPPAARSAPVAALGLRLANTLEAELARADAPASRGAGGEGPGRLPAPVRRHLEASDEWCRIACGPLAVANIVAAEQAAGAAPSANDLSVSRDSHGIHGLGPSVDEIDGKMPDGA
ncbi:hypothetical protein FNF29_03740 [Cafeteria roenbergensis]|uniref:Uncharacterized protein n=1 Tax=Cafeteria roenbergensis TaxID=33653 RepID=A0A5A8CHJ0_CAFRO|nr:hypothetical protein FNF29_03740 [Cafeteria roenbergensis]|eukprot:KAA0152513.1 hypothetical protein FNF29_03740 [Cafeteria roenbergensis]